MIMKMIGFSANQQISEGETKQFLNSFSKWIYEFDVTSAHLNPTIKPSINL